MTASPRPHSWDYYVSRYEEASDLQSQLQNDVSQIESGNFNQIAIAYEDLTALIAKNPIWADLFTPGSPAAARLTSINQSMKTYLQGITLQVEDPNNPGQYINLYEGSTYYDSSGAIQPSYTGSSATDGHPPPTSTTSFQEPAGRFLPTQTQAIFPAEILTMQTGASLEN